MWRCSVKLARIEERRRRTVKDGQASKLRPRAVKSMIAPSKSGEQDGVIRRLATQDAAAMVTVEGMWSWTAQKKGAKQVW
jgi:predicted PilT family ATPase